MIPSELRVLVVDDDFRVANLHAGIVSALPGFTVGATVHTLAAARSALAAGERGDRGGGAGVSMAAATAFDLALIDVYLPDGSGVELVREIRCDAMMLTAATESETVRAALAAGALAYLVKPFDHAALAARLAGYARYRRLLSAPVVTPRDIDSALESLRPAGSAGVRAGRGVPDERPGAPGDPGLADGALGRGGLRRHRRLPSHRPALPGQPGRRRHPAHAAALRQHGPPRAGIRRRTHLTEFRYRFRNYS